MLVSRLLALALLFAASGCHGDQVGPDSPEPVNRDSASTGDSADSADTDHSGGTDDSGESGAPPLDADMDGFASVESGGTDCDDDDARTFPGAAEQCDYADRDCDGELLPPDGCVGVPEMDDVAWARWEGDPDYGDTYQALGYDVWMAGDLDGDGRGDPFVMCPGCEDGSDARIGGFYVLETADRPILGASYTERERASWVGDGFFYEMGGIAGAGDFDGDGAPDVAFTGDEYDAPGWLAIKYGPLDATWPVRGAIDASVDAWWYTWSAGADDGFGNWWASDILPDASGDGLPEIVVGRARHTGDDGLLHAEVYLFPGGDARGTAGGDVADALAILDPAESTLDSIASAGDFNGDGLGDLIVTRDAMREDGVMRDSHDVLDGSLLVTGAVVAPADVALASWSARNTGGWGACLVSLGDWNGDGYEDIAVGDDSIVTNAATTHDDGPGVWFVAGRASGQLSEEIAEDAAGAVVDGEAHAINGVGRCAGHGDFDGDGRGDLAVSAPRQAGYGVGGTNPDSREAIWLLPGRGGFPSGLVAWEDTALSIGGLTLAAEEDGSNLGNALSMGDTNADGLDDVLVGAYQWDDNRGAVYVIRGWEVDWAAAR